MQPIECLDESFAEDLKACSRLSVINLALAATGEEFLENKNQSPEAQCCEENAPRVDLPP